MPFKLLFLWLGVSGGLDARYFVAKHESTLCVCWPQEAVILLRTKRSASGLAVAEVQQWILLRDGMFSSDRCHAPWSPFLSWSWFVSEWLQVGLFHTCQQNTMQAYFGFMGKLMGRVACLNPIAYCTLASPIILYYFIYSSHIYFYFICNIYI